MDDGGQTISDMFIADKRFISLDLDDRASADSVRESLGQI
jgi:hypothetical protein